MKTIWNKVKAAFNNHTPENARNWGYFMVSWCGIWALGYVAVGLPWSTAIMVGFLILHGVVCERRLYATRIQRDLADDILVMQRNANTMLADAYVREVRELYSTKRELAELKALIGDNTDLAQQTRQWLAEEGVTAELVDV